METIIRQLSENFYNSLGNNGQKLGKEIPFNGGCVWIDGYDENDNTFVVCVFHDNGNESPNVEKFLEDKLSSHIDISDAIYEAEVEEEREMKADYETNQCICQLNGWNY